MAKKNEKMVVEEVKDVKKDFVDLINEKYDALGKKGYTPFKFKFVKAGAQVYLNGEKYALIDEATKEEDKEWISGMLDDHNYGYKAGYESAYFDIMEILDNEFNG